ncbi:MAG: RHS repeat-associated core domain-containing protein, partial [Planctomycetia bacterium]|nr:RHS repeat-associated core domain-containing protein [Planctomycetia bacterium]
MPGRIQKYRYDAHGRSKVPLDGKPFRYTGRRLDPETGLYYYRARYYSSNIGRFVNRRPRLTSYRRPTLTRVMGCLGGLLGSSLEV